MSLLDSLINEDILGRDAGAGKFPKSAAILQVFNPTTSQHVPELTTEAENVLLGL
jgi:hypothetical protein